MSNTEAVYVDQEGYNKLLKELEDLQQELLENNAIKADAYENAGDGWHDNFSFEEATRREHMLMGQIEQLRKSIANAVVIEKTENDEIIDIGDIIDVATKLNGEQLPDYSFQLVAGSGDSLEDLPKISINSPLGNAVYQKKVGDAANYKVDGRLFDILILSKQKGQKEKEKSIKMN